MRGNRRPGCRRRRWQSREIYVEQDPGKPLTPRSHLRVTAEAEVVLRIPGEHFGGNLDLIATFSSLDVSAGGIQVGVDIPLRLDTLLKLNVTIPALRETFKLVGRVAWCHLNEVKHPSWLVGVQLVASQGSELRRWQDSMAQV